MSQILETLRGWGCDVNGAMERMLNDEDFYTMCLRETVKDPAFQRLGEALNAGQTEQAFEEAHSLKGVLANLGLTPLLNQTVQIVEPLRAGHCEGLTPYYEALLAENEKLKQILGE